MLARNIQIFTKLAYTYNQSLFITHKIHLNKILGFERKREREWDAQNRIRVVIFVVFDSRIIN